MQQIEQRSYLRYVVQAAGEHEVGRQRTQRVAGHAVVPVQGGVAHEGEDGVHDPGGQEAQVAHQEVEGVQHLCRQASLTSLQCSGALIGSTF